MTSSGQTLTWSPLGPTSPIHQVLRLISQNKVYILWIHGDASESQWLTSDSPPELAICSTFYPFSSLTSPAARSRNASNRADCTKAWTYYTILLCSTPYSVWVAWWFTQYTGQSKIPSCGMCRPQNIKRPTATYSIHSIGNSKCSNFYFSVWGNTAYLWPLDSPKFYWNVWFLKLPSVYFPYYGTHVSYHGL